MTVVSLLAAGLILSSAPPVIANQTDYTGIALLLTSVSGVITSLVGVGLLVYNRFKPQKSDLSEQIIEAWLAERRGK